MFSMDWFTQKLLSQGYRSTLFTSLTWVSPSLLRSLYPSQTCSNSQVTKDNCKQRQLKSTSLKPKPNWTKTRKKNKRVSCLGQLFSDERLLAHTTKGQEDSSYSIYFLLGVHEEGHWSSHVLHKHSWYWLCTLHTLEIYLKGSDFRWLLNWWDYGWSNI